MKKIFILTIFLSLFLVGCGGEDTTTEMTTTIDTFINTEILAPVIAIDQDQVYWSEVNAADSYEVLVKDVTTANTELLLEDEIYPVEGTSFFVDDLDKNRIYEISVRSVVGDEHSIYSNTVNVRMFIQTEVVWTYTFNVNSTDYFAVYGHEIPELYYIEEEGNRISTDNYHFDYELLLMENAFMKEYSEGVIFKLYTEQGIIDLEVNYVTGTTPYIRSNNTTEFTNQDLLFVFELCGGTFAELSGSDITSQDYELYGNILIIDAAFIQDLFDTNPDRESVILSYQLRNGENIVVGYLFINKEFSVS